MREKNLFVGAVATLIASTAALAGGVSGLRFVDRAVVPYTPGFNGTVFENTLFAGISGLDYDPAAGNFVAISDDRSQNAPPRGLAAARFYRVSIAFDGQGFVGESPIVIDSVAPLLRPDGTTFPTLSVDPESIRRRGSTSLLWTSEGAASASSNPPLQNPFVREMNLDGSYVREFATPDSFHPDGVGAAQTKGVRNNLGFESAALTPDGSTLYVATESALLQDGPIASFAAGAIARVIEFDVASGAPLRELVYPVDPIPVNPNGQFADTGLTELFAIDDSTLLAVERAFITGFGNHVRIYRVTFDGASDVSGLPSLIGQRFVPMTKQLLIALTPDLGFPPDNIEGITEGPTLPGGARSFLLVSDNNFSAAQATHVLLLAETADADLNGDGTVGAEDLAVLVGAWGEPGTGDINLDGTVDASDLALLLGAWTV